MAASDHHAVVRRSFQQQVGLFDGEQAPFARQLAAPPTWLGPLHPEMIVLDVACGAAHAAEVAAPHVRQVVGLDVTPDLLELGAQRLRDAGVVNVLLQEGDAAALPFLDASFDVVACRSSVHHFPQPDRPVAEMARVCRPGGRVVVSDMVAPNAEVRPAFDELHRRLDPSHVGVLLDTELAELLRSIVGSLSSAETSVPFALPVDQILTDAADRDAVLAALRAELDGGPPTGFSPRLDPGGVVVSFMSATVHATRDRP